MTQRPRCADRSVFATVALPLVVLLLAVMPMRLWADAPDASRLPPALPAVSPGAVGAQTVAARVAPDIWLIDSRRAVPGQLLPTLICHRYQAGLWVRASEHEFVAAQDTTTPTCFWVHGNRIAEGEAIDEGLAVYRYLNARATRPFRFVIWSWPSARVQGDLRDVRLKAQVSDIYAYPLARLVDQMDPRVELSFLGYSYGARLICGALHLRRPRQLTARGLPYQAVAYRPPIRVVLLAAAMDNDSFRSGGRNACTLSHVGQMLITVNRNDPAMRWYQMLYGVPGPPALGFSGATGVSAPGLLHLDVSEPLGTNHELEGYLSMSDFAAWLGLRPPAQP